MNRFEWFVAWRYLFNRQRRALVSVITIISMAGVAVGVAALITVIGVMDGADELLFGRIADLYPHVRIQDLRGSESRLDSELLARLRADERIAYAEPVIQKQAIAQVHRGIDAPKKGVILLGVDRVGAGELYDILDTDLVQGVATTVVDPETGEEGEVVELGPRDVLIGGPLAGQLGAGLNRRLIVIAASNPVRTATVPVFKQLKFRVVGHFKSGFYEFDANTAVVSEAAMRELFRVPEGGFDFIHVKLKDPFTATKYKRELGLEMPFYVTTWAEENGQFFSALKLEKYAMFIILLLIIFVAAFNIIGTLILMVIDKTREIGILRAIGAGRRVVARIFLLNGVLIGLVGTAIGLVIGLVLCALIPIAPLEMPAAIYNFDHLPVEVRPLTVITIVVSSMAICTLAALFPAMQAARLHPVEALRHD